MKILEITLLRLSQQDDSTIGALYDENKELLCWTLEDSFNEPKINGETRIPPGRYQLRLRDWGGFHERYSKRFPDIHKGMIELCRVPQFQDILIHCGNTTEDTSGCLLLGAKITENRFRNGTLEYSEQAYTRVYPYIVDLFSKGDVYIIIKDVTL